MNDGSLLDGLGRCKMAQVLKEDQRNKILISAKTEFLKKGIEGSSMRVIAENAGTTVGNLYRYYENKQKLVEAVLMPILGKLGYFDKYVLDDIMKFTKTSLSEFLSNWVDILVEVQNEHPIEMHIIVSDELINSAYHEKLYIMIKEILLSVSNENGDKEEAIEMMARMIAKSVFAGIREGVRLKCDSEIEKEEFKEVMTRFMRSSFSILENI